MTIRTIRIPHYFKGGASLSVLVTPVLIFKYLDANFTRLAF